MLKLARCVILCYVILCYVILYYVVGLLTPNSSEASHLQEITDIISSNCITDIDVWHYLVSLCFAMPSLFANRTHLIPAGEFIVCLT